MQLIFDRGGSERGPGPRRRSWSSCTGIPPRRPAPGCGPTSSARWTARSRARTAAPGSINTVSDHHVFAMHRALADAVVVGAGTARTEGYRAVDLAPWQQAIRQADGLAPLPTLVVVSAVGRARPAHRHRGRQVRVARSWSRRPRARRAALSTRCAAPGSRCWSWARRPWTCLGWSDELAGRGLPRLLCEGGPRLHRDLLAGRSGRRAVALTLAPGRRGGGFGLVSRDRTKRRRRVCPPPLVDFDAPVQPARRRRGRCSPATGAAPRPSSSA